MDLIAVLRPFFDFVVRFCSVTISLGGFSFTVGALFTWCILACVLISFVKGLAR